MFLYIYGYIIKFSFAKSKHRKFYWFFVYDGISLYWLFQNILNTCILNPKIFYMSVIFIVLQWLHGHVSCIISAVITALRNLQGKIHQLEVERTAAEDNLKSLASETNKYKDILERDSEAKKPAQTTVSKHNQGM